MGTTEKDYLYREEYYQKNRNKIKEYSKNYYDRNKKKINNSGYYKDGRRFWTQREITFLENNYLIMGNKEIGNNLNRTWGTVNIKLRALGLKRGKEIFSKIKSKRMTGENNPMFGFSGEKSPNYGKKLSEERKKKISLTNSGRNRTKEEREKISISNLGKRRSESQKEKQIEMMKIMWRDPNSKFNSQERKDKIRKSKIGNKNPAWLGGKSFEPYTLEFNKQFKLAIKQRDGFMCLRCGMREEDAKQLFKRALHIHHIDYIKENTFKENCCTLCLRCNTEVNKNRPSWTKFFQSMLSEKYGYKYNENGEIVLEFKDDCCQLGGL